MELRVLRYFLAIADEGTISRAAERLHITQPTLSRQIMQLEDELGVSLFERRHQEMQLTQEGRRLRAHAEEILVLADRTPHILHTPSSILSGSISYITAFQAEYPAVAFHVTSGIADDVLAQLDQGNIDLGLVVEPVYLADYDRLQIPGTDRWAALVRRDSPLASQATVTAQELSCYPLLIGRRLLVQKEIAGWFGNRLDRLTIAGHYTLHYNAAHLVRAGLGIAIGFEFNDHFEDLRYIPLTPAIQTGSVLVHANRAKKSLAVETFLAFLRDQLCTYASEA